MSLADLIGGDFSGDESSEDDPSFSPTQEFTGEPDMKRKSVPPSGCACFGVPYDFVEDDENAEYDHNSGPEGVNDEIRCSNERFFSPRLQELLRGSMSGGNPTSHTGLLTGVKPMLLHQTQSPHPERPARMVAIYNEIIERGLDARSRLVPCRTASMDDLKLVHTAEQVSKSTSVYPSDAAATEALGIDSDTYFDGQASGYAAMLSAGSVVEMTTRVVQGELRNGLAVVRPPGHHCEANQAMGFCVLNNVCVAVAVARRRLGVSRVLVVDWDVHHGNGVQNIFEDDPNVLYISLHRYGRGFYPGTGGPHEVGFGAGEGTSVNVAWSHEGYGDAEYLAAFDRVIMPIAREYGPDLVLVSAGFDAAKGDPLGGMAISPAGYAHMTAALATLAAGRLVVVLEGGYNLRSISHSAAAVLSTLLGDPLPMLERRPPKSHALADLEVVVSAVKQYWASLRPPVREQDKRQARTVQAQIKKARRPRGPWWYKYLY